MYSTAVIWIGLKVLGIEDAMVFHVVTVDVVLLDNKCLTTQLAHVVLNISELTMGFVPANERGIAQVEDAGDRPLLERVKPYTLSQPGHAGVG